VIEVEEDPIAADSSEVIEELIEELMTGAAC
jgi:hypothetical protein